MTRPEKRYPHKSTPLSAHTLKQAGKQFMYIPGKLAYFEGMSPSDSRNLLDSLLDRVLKPAVTYRHKWSKGDLVIWG